MKVHIGQIIKSEYEKSGMKLNVFADRLGMTYRNIYRIFDKEDINTDLLKKLCNVLNYDFFVHFVKESDNVIKEPEPEYKKKEVVSPLVSLTIAINDPKQRAQVLDILFGGNVPPYLL